MFFKKTYSGVYPKEPNFWIHGTCFKLLLLTLIFQCGGSPLKLNEHFRFFFFFFEMAVGHGLILFLWIFFNMQKLGQLSLCLVLARPAVSI